MLLSRSSTSAVGLDHFRVCFTPILGAQDTQRFIAFIIPAFRNRTFPGTNPLFLWWVFFYLLTVTCNALPADSEPHS